MLNLYWRSKDQTRSLVEMPFQSEAELECYIFEHQEILGGDISIMYRQVHTGSKQGIPDMLGVDQDSRICIIELKNAETGEEILPQALGYAIWAEMNPDSIKAIWLESKARPEDIEVDWDNLDIRVILVAPAFKSTVARMAGKMGYPIDLVQVRRYCAEEDEFLLVEVLDKTMPKVVTTKVKGEWDWDYYESEHGHEATSHFRRTVEAIVALVAGKGWNIPFNINKDYTGFKIGNRVVFSVAWGGTHAWKVRFKVPEAVARAFQGQQWELQSYDQAFHEAIFRPLVASPKIDGLEPLFFEAYRNVSSLD